MDSQAPHEAPLHNNTGGCNKSNPSTDTQRRAWPDVSSRIQFVNERSQQREYGQFCYEAVNDHGLHAEEVVCLHAFRLFGGRSGRFYLRLAEAAGPMHALW